MGNPRHGSVPAVEAPKGRRERQSAEHRRQEAKLEKRTHDLADRVKELQCLYNLCLLLGRERPSVLGIARGAVELLPSAWQHSETACARVVLEGAEAETHDFRETEWTQVSDIVVEGILCCYKSPSP